MIQGRHSCGNCGATADEKQNAEASDARRFSQIILILSFYLRRSAFSASSASYFSGQTPMRQLLHHGG